MKKLALTLILSSMVGVIAEGMAHALQVTPPYQLIDLNSGEAGLGECTITNNEDKPLNIKVHTKDWFILPENKANDIKATDWLIVEENEFVLQPGEAKKIGVTIKAPEKAVGELVGMVSVEFYGEAKTMVNQMVSVAVYAAITGTDKLNAELDALSIMPEASMLRVGVNVKNTGNVHVRPTGQVKIYDANKALLRDVFIQQGRPIYPGRKNSYYGQIHGDLLKPGLYEAHVLLRDVDRETDIIDTRHKIKITEDNKVELIKK
jgi:hypothetical protein